MIDHFTSILLNQPIEIEFDRIKNGFELSSNNIPYTIEYINILIKYFESEEEYEKCMILLKCKSSKIHSHDKKFNLLTI